MALPTTAAVRIYVAPNSETWVQNNLNMKECLELVRAAQNKILMYLHHRHNENCDRVAPQRRLPSDDAWLNPHNPRLAMFANASMHVLPFDPRFGADHARQYVRNSVHCVHAFV